MAAQFGMVGLGTMGLNLVLNIAEKGFTACGYDRDPAQQKRLADAAGSLPITVASSMKQLVDALATPRKIMLLVPAGKIVDMVIDEVSPFLQAGDILIDGGNSHFVDTEKRIQRLSPTGIHFTGMGVSGGEDGARLGPSLMPGGSPDSYAELSEILEKIAARTTDGPCVTFIGNGAAGHYTKMVHNGIEYAMMQLISEVYGMLRTYGGLSVAETERIFDTWNNAELQSFLVEITALVLRKIDDDTGSPLVEVILDKAKQKGTGMWTSQSAMDLNVPTPTIDAAVSMRYLSAMKQERTTTALMYPKHTPANPIPQSELVEKCREALSFGFILSYAQGLQLLSVASSGYNYNINIAEVIRVWKGGCIIRSKLLYDLERAYRDDETLSNVIHAPSLRDTLQKNLASVVSLIAAANEAGLPVAALSASLQYFNSYRTAQLPANLIQAQRDFFGAHTYERIDQPGTFHAEWIDKPPVVTSEQKPKQE